MNCPLIGEHCGFADKRFLDHSQRVVNPPSSQTSTSPGGVRISDAVDRIGGNNNASDAKKKKLKAYRRSDSAASGGGSRSRSTTKELALPPDDSLMCPPRYDQCQSMQNRAKQDPSSTLSVFPLEKVVGLPGFVIIHTFIVSFSPAQV